ncbi:hypothetical protein K504DRAFT_515057 [Pleomassaria siparia CBS 279.74]|uniref:DUF7708 domain-containing protein n=1 Tax=Pleomassaria siparia CBS 279.74 TaxID=1314801 RepID=A0A6G1JXD7_9PLEO|nr:hypothetical protein K504DRAFT_515057 [Pleomassaria siparia CBS 279.74]
MSTFSEQQPGRDPSTQPYSLQAVVETYILNKLDITLHPSFPDLQQFALVQSGRPTSDHSVSTTAPFVASNISNVLVDEADEDEELSLEDLYRDVEEESRRFAQAMKEYENALDTKAKKKLVLGTSLHTWEEVLTEVDTASTEYHDPSGRLGKIRKAFRSIGNKAGPASAWFGLLPSESEYLSIVCGGLKLMVGAASRLQDLREDIADALIDIPTILFTTNQALNTFTRSKQLHQRSSEVFVAIIAVLQHILTYYKVKSTMFKQGEHERKLTDKLDILKARADRCERIAQTCHHQLTKHTNTSVRAAHKDVNRNATELHQHLHINRLEAHEQHTVMSDNVQSLTEQFQQLQYLSHCVLGTFLASNDRLHPKTQDLRGPTLPLKKALSAPALKKLRDNTEQGCLAALNYENSATDSDIQRNLRCIHTLPRPAQDRVIAIIRHHKFQSWLVDLNPSVLFLNGNHVSMSPIRQTPTSFVCAKLAYSIRTGRDKLGESSSTVHFSTMVLSFFCAEHLDQKDPLYGAVSIMQSLIAQLLVNYKAFDIAVIQRLKKAYHEDLDVLCAKFKDLIRHLPNKMIVFCVVDAITMHEESELRRKDVAFVLQTLVNGTTGKEGRQCLFKLLITSPRISRSYSRQVRDEERVVTMPNKVPSQGGFTAAKWNDCTNGGNGFMNR